MAGVTKENKQTWFTAIITGASTAFFIMLVVGGLQLWKNDGQQDERISNNAVHTQENREMIEKEYARLMTAVEDLKGDMREDRTARCQADGEQRALLMQIIQEMKK